MSSVKAKAEEFIELHGGNIVGDIQGQSGAIAYKVVIGERTFHIYYSRDWYRKYDGISIPDHALDVGLKENATIVMYVLNDCVWQYASEWMRLSRIIKNKMYGGTMENLIKKEDLLRGTFAQQPKGINNSMDGYF
jgi:hypothetical protein